MSHPTQKVQIQGCQTAITISAEGCPTQLAGQHCSLITYEAFFSRVEKSSEDINNSLFFMSKKGLIMLIFLMLLLLILLFLMLIFLMLLLFILLFLLLFLYIWLNWRKKFWFNTFFLYCLCLFLPNLSQGAIGQPKQTTSLCDLLPTKIPRGLLTFYLLLSLLFVQNVFFTVCKLFMFLFCINV